MEPPSKLPTVRVVAPAVKDHSVTRIQGPTSVHAGAQRLAASGRVRRCALIVGDGLDAGVSEPGWIKVGVWNLGQDRLGHGSHHSLRSVGCLVLDRMVALGEGA